MDYPSEVPLSNGKFSMVSKAYVDNQWIVKKIPQASTKARGYFSNETRIHQELNHINIVTFLALWNEPQPTLVTKYITGGNLHDMVRNKAIRLSFDFQLSVAIDVAQGLNYLHKLKILHRDIKAQNVFLEETSHGMLAKIGDFGFSVYEANAPFMDLSGSPFAFSPELFRRMSNPPVPFSKYSDVYAYAVLLWQLVSGPRPLVLRARNAEEFGDKIISGKRLPIAKNTPENLASLIKNCWQHQPHKRPLTETILLLLYKMRDELTKSRQPEVLKRVDYGLKNRSGSQGFFEGNSTIRANVVSLGGEFSRVITPHC